MKVRLLVAIAGDNYSHAPGAEIDLDDAEAARFIERDMAEPVEDAATDAAKKSRKAKD